MDEILLPGLPIELIRAAYEFAAGKELVSRKFYSPRSSSALAANTFGFFLNQPGALPPIPGAEGCGWPAQAVSLEAEVRFPWTGGTHPHLDALINTCDHLIGVEAKRYEPFKSQKKPSFSEAYWQPVWGCQMAGYERVRDGLRDRSLHFARLNATQLVKHAFGLRTEANRARCGGCRPLLVYLYAEPEAWPDNRPVSSVDAVTHRSEISRFAELVLGDEVVFISITYQELLASWQSAASEEVQQHAKAVTSRYSL